MASAKCLPALYTYCKLQSQSLAVSAITGCYLKYGSYLLLRQGVSEAHAGVQMGSLRLIHSSSCLGAGHSKWHNIKHIKAAVDREKSTKSRLLSQKVRLLLEKNSETDPKHNAELASLIKWARLNNLTTDIIENIIEQQIKLRDPKSITSFIGRGPSNTGVVIECFSLKPNHTKDILQGLVKKCGFSFKIPADDLFDHKGLIDVELLSEDLPAAQADHKNFSIDKYIERAIEAGAENVTLEVDDDDKPYLRFVCGPQDLNKVTRNLDDAGLNVISSEATYIPTNVVKVSQEFMESLKKMTDKLDINQDVIKYHFNVEPENSS